MVMQKIKGRLLRKLKKQQAPSEASTVNNANNSDSIHQNLSVIHEDPIELEKED